MKDDKSEAAKMWHDWFMTDAFKVEKRMFRVFRALPHDPRCKICYAPFDGVGGYMMRTLFGRKQSTLNPHFCNVCEDFAERNPGGDEVEMAILFADIRGSTALSEQMPVSEFRALINRFFVASTNVIVKENGLVEKLSGDAVAAFWGAGFAGPHYVARTIRAAQSILEIMQEQKIPVGIGVHAGVAYFGAMGSADGLVNISAIGDAVNTAARLASKASAGEIIVSEAALRQADMEAGNLESRSLELKGISDAVAVRVMRI